MRTSQNDCIYMIIMNYTNFKSIDAAIEKARAIPRERALQKVAKKSNTDRVVFVVTYDPRLPSIANIFKKHHSIMAH